MTRDSGTETTQSVRLPTTRHNPNDEVETLREQRWLEREREWDEEEAMDRRLAENFAPTGEGWTE